MIRYFWRSFWVLWLAWRTPKQDLEWESVVQFRALWGDMDTNGHMNNGRYLTVMDFGRVHLSGVVGLAKPVIKKRCQPLVAVSAMRHFKSVEFMQKMTIKTRLAGLDQKWFYFEQRIFVADQLVCVGLIKGLIMGQGRKIPTEEVLSWMGLPPRKIKIPVYFKDLDKTESSLIRVLKRERQQS